MTELNENENMEKLKEIVETRKLKEISKDRLLTLNDLFPTRRDIDKLIRRKIKSEAVKRAKYWKEKIDSSDNPIDVTYFRGRLSECMEFNNLKDEVLK